MNVFELIKEKLDKYITETYYESVKGNRDAGIRNNAYHNAISIVNEVQKEYNNGWIPCSERFPSDCAIHEVTAQFSNGKIYTEFAYYDESREEWWKFDDDSLVNVLAWKEHSEPYKEGGTE